MAIARLCCHVHEPLGSRGDRPNLPRNPAVQCFLNFCPSPLLPYYISLQIHISPARQLLTKRPWHSVSAKRYASLQP